MGCERLAPTDCTALCCFGLVGCGVAVVVAGLYSHWVEQHLIPLNAEIREWMASLGYDTSGQPEDGVLSPEAVLVALERIEEVSVEHLASELAHSSELLCAFLVRSKNDGRVAGDFASLEVHMMTVRGVYGCMFPEGCLEYLAAFAQMAANVCGPCVLGPVLGERPFLLVAPSGDDGWLREHFERHYPEFRNHVRLRWFD
jgi:hypothetical protein